MSIRSKSSPISTAISPPNSVWPRQSGLIEELTASIVFEPPYRQMEAIRGLEDFSHIWLIWQFSQARRDRWSPTVRPAPA